jgi:hypothetical protein
VSVPNCGKKTERLWLPRQLCTDLFLAARLRDRAGRNCRKLHDEIRFLLIRALDSQEAQDGNEQKLIFTRSPRLDGGAEMSPGRQSKTLRPDQIERLEKFRRMAHDGAPHGYSIPQLCTAIGAQFKWGTLRRALKGLPIWDLFHGFIVQWIESNLPLVPLPDGKTAAAGDRDERDQEKAGATRTLRESR